MLISLSKFTNEIVSLTGDHGRGSYEGSFEAYFHRLVSHIWLYTARVSVRNAFSRVRHISSRIHCSSHNILKTAVVIRVDSTDEPLDGTLSLFISCFMNGAHRIFIMVISIAANFAYLLLAISTVVWYRLWTLKINGLIPLTRIAVDSSPGLDMALFAQVKNQSCP